jgi:hypothetical protein
VNYLACLDGFYVGHLPTLFLSQLGKFAKAAQAGSFLNKHMEGQPDGQLRSKYADLEARSKA